MYMEKYVKGHGITLDSAGSWSFNNDIGRNVNFFGVDDSSSSHSDNCKNNFLILGEGLTYGINGSLSLNCNADNSYLFVNGKEILNLKLTIKMLTFQLNFVSKVFLMDLVILGVNG